MPASSHHLLVLLLPILLPALVSSRATLPPERPDCTKKECKNFGEWVEELCQCKCYGHLGGLECEQCVENDEDWCTGFLPESMCGEPGGPEFQLCPHFCNLCPDTCNGKRCQNFGALNITSCECQCKHGFSGKYCETCPGEDEEECLWNAVPEDCNKSPFDFANTRTACPYMCGVCTKSSEP